MAAAYGRKQEGKKKVRLKSSIAALRRGKRERGPGS